MSFIWAKLGVACASSDGRLTDLGAHVSFTTGC